MVDRPRSAALLARLRKAKGLSQPELARLVHTSQAQISRLELGERPITKRWAVPLARVLGCHWLEFMDAAAPPAGREAKLVEYFRMLADVKAEQDAVYMFAEAMAERRKRENPQR